MGSQAGFAGYSSPLFRYAAQSGAGICSERPLIAVAPVHYMETVATN